MIGYEPSQSRFDEGASDAEVEASQARLCGELRGAAAALGPDVEDLEEAAKWAGGEGEIVGKAGHPLVGRAAEIFDILTADEEEEAPPAR